MDPHDAPRITLGVLSNPADVVVIRKQIRLAIRLAQEMKARRYSLKPLRVPQDDTDEQFDAYARENTRTGSHFTSTCRMAPEKDEVSPGVVDDQLRVWGVKNLRVCDASVFPDIVSKHPMAPVVAIAERCANLIKSANAGPGEQCAATGVGNDVSFWYYEA